MYEYRLQPTPPASKKAKGLKTVPERFSHALTEMLNIEARSGWEFVGQESFSVAEKSGLRKKVKTTELVYLVFRRKIAPGAVPLDQKLENIKKKKSQTMVSPATARPFMTKAIPPLPEKSAPAAEPFPEPMPAHVPEEPTAELSVNERQTDSSRSLPFPGPSPEQTMGMTSESAAPSAFNQAPTLNFDHSNGSTGASVDAPILGPAKRG